MNLSTQEDIPHMLAKVCSVRSKARVTYAFSSNSDFLFLGKRDILLNQLDACERLLKYATDEDERRTLIKEIDELRAALDLLQ
jgi:hypothetical protein